MIKATFFPNGMNMAFEGRAQVAVAQKSWLIVFAEYLAANGIDPEKCVFDMPNGCVQRVTRFEEDGEVWYNFSPGDIM